jgi:putative transposase
VLKHSPQREEASHRRKRPVGRSGRMAAPDIRIRGHWRSLARAAAKAGPTSDLLGTTPRDCAAALRFLGKAIGRQGVPETLTPDGSEASASAIRGDNEAHGTTIITRPVRSPKNVVEPGHRAVKRMPHPMLGVKSGEAAHGTRAGIERMHMSRKGQGTGGAEQGLTAAEQC